MVLHRKRESVLTGVHLCPFVLPFLGQAEFGQVHARAVAGNDHAVLAAVYDLVAEGLQFPGQASYGAAIHTVEVEIAAADDIDVVILCTLTDLHAQQIEQFARADKAVFCEKPIDLETSARVCVNALPLSSRPAQH